MENQRKIQNPFASSLTGKPLSRISHPKLKKPEETYKRNIFSERNIFHQSKPLTKLSEGIAHIISNDFYSALRQEPVKNTINTSKLDFLQQETDSLKKLYQFREANLVERFLFQNKHLFPLLKEIPEMVRHYFGEKQKLVLKISFEPDSPQSGELWVLIVTPLSVDEAFPRLEKFDENWWLDNIDRADCKLNISLEYL